MMRLNKKLAALALVCAFGALFAGIILPDGANGSNENPPFISVVDLAEQIKNRAPIHIIDLRDSALFAEFHLPSAKRVSMHQIKSGDLPTGSLVFYSGDDPLCRKLWTELDDHTKKRSVILYGGIHDWYEHLLYPKLPIRVEPDKQDTYDLIETLSLFYGGQPEFVEDPALMNYYLQDFSTCHWPRSHRQNGLVRKGC